MTMDTVFSIQSLGFTIFERSYRSGRRNQMLSGDQIDLGIIFDKTGEVGFVRRPKRRSQKRPDVLKLAGGELLFFAQSLQLQLLDFNSVLTKLRWWSTSSDTNDQSQQQRSCISHDFLVDLASLNSIKASSRKMPQLRKAIV